MRSVLNYGSINIDHVYRVPAFVRPGETLASRQYQRGTGGKGYNQTVALARAGARVSHAGKVGRDGEFVLETLRNDGVDTRHVTTVDTPTGHAIIQVDDAGENAIVLFGGANQEVTVEEATAVVKTQTPGDWLLLQNEISCVGEILELGLKHGLRVAFNPAPMTDAVADLPLGRLGLLVLNESEGAGLSGETEVSAILDALQRRWPETAIVLTAGSAGAHYVDSNAAFFEPAARVTPVDTTAAGDTFVGYLLAELVAGSEPRAALRLATKAAGVCVTRRGAASAIPRRDELR